MILYYILGLFMIFTSGFMIFKLCTPFVIVKKSFIWKCILFLLLSGTTGMVIWVGDLNLLYTLPIFLLGFLISTTGNFIGRLSVALIFFSMIMSICALSDTYIAAIFKDLFIYDFVAKLSRILIILIIYMLMYKILPKQTVTLSDRLWKLILGLSAMPICSLAAIVLLTYNKYDLQEVYSLSMNLGLAVLPVVLITCVVLLVSITVLVRHQELETSSRLASLRETYYKGLQNQEQSIRQLRHDLRNHLTVLSGLLEKEDIKSANNYINKLYNIKSLKGVKNFCDNELINVVMCAKIGELENQNIKTDISINVPKKLPFSDIDICALFGNALDNAKEGVRGCENPIVLVRCRFDKGLFMLKVENPVIKKVNDDLSTTKQDKSKHGFGIIGMKDIAIRNGGTLEAGVKNGKFSLIVCLPEKIGD